MAIAKGMTDREWVIHEKARCLQCLLSSVMESVDDMRTSMIGNISKLAEEESEGDPEIRHEREQYYLNVFNISISIHSNLCGKGSCFLNVLFGLHILILSCILYKSQSSSQKDSPMKTDSYS